MTAQDRKLHVASGPYRLTVRDFEVLDQSGAFDAHTKTELLAGEIFFMNAQHRPHGMVKMRLYDALSRELASIRSPLAVAVEVSVRLSEHDAPEPDLTLTSEPDGEGMIPIESIALIIEVADATLDYDLGPKLRAYAAAGVPEFWVADVNGRVIHQMWAPAGEAYAERREVAFADAIEAMTIAGLRVTTEGL